MQRQDGIEQTVGPFADGVDPAVVVAEWWAESHGCRLPGEEDGHTVFVIMFADGCRFFDYTTSGVMARVVDLGCGPVPSWRDEFVSTHVDQMTYILQCIGSNLGAEDARELRDLLVREAPGDVRKRHGKAVDVRGCPLGEDASPALSMTFGEWVKSRDGVIERGNSE